MADKAAPEKHNAVLVEIGFDASYREMQADGPAEAKALALMMLGDRLLKELFDQGLVLTRIDDDPDRDVRRYAIRVGVLRPPESVGNAWPPWAKEKLDA